MPMVPPGRSRDDVTAAASLFRSLGDPARLAIVMHLATGELKSSNTRFIDYVEGKAREENLIVMRGRN